MAKKAINVSESSVYRYYNCNPHRRLTDDCVIRAVSAATGESWDKTLQDLTDYSKKYGWMLNTPQIYGRYLKDRGWVKQKQPVKKNGQKVRFKEFCQKFNGHAVAHCGKNHITLCADNRVWDTWDVSDEVVGNYWVYKSELDLVVTDVFE